MKSSDIHPMDRLNHTIKKIIVKMIKKIVTIKISSVIVAYNLILNNTRHASDSSAPRRVTYFGGIA